MARRGRPIALGRAGENEARQVVFDLAEWRALYGAGTVELIAQRCGEETLYPVALTVEEDTALWTVGAADTALPGNGRAELRYLVGEQLAKSEAWRTVVQTALGEPSGPPPEAQQGWVDQVLQAGAEVKEAIQHTPHIGENGHWYVWDAESGKYADSGAGVDLPDPDWLADEGKAGHIKNRPIGTSLTQLMNYMIGDTSAGGYHWIGWDVRRKYKILSRPKLYALDINGTWFSWLPVGISDSLTYDKATGEYLGDEDISVWASGGGIGFQVYLARTINHNYFRVYLSVDTKRFPGATEANTTLYRINATNQIGSDWLPIATSDTPGVVLAEEMPENDTVADLEAYYSALLVHDGMAYAPKNIVGIEYRGFSLTERDFRCDFGTCLVFDHFGDSSAYFPELAYPVKVTMITSYGTNYLETADGRRYSFFVTTNDDSSINISSVVEITPFISYKTGLVELYSVTQKGITTHNSLGLVEGQKYTIRWDGSVSGSIDCVAVYCEALGMVACLSDGSSDTPTSNRCYIGNTQSYMSAGFASVMGVVKVTLMGHEILPSIPVAAIDGLRDQTPLVITPMQSDDGTNYSRVPASEIMERLYNGEPVYFDVPAANYVQFDLNASFSAGKPVAYCGRYVCIIGTSSETGIDFYGPTDEEYWKYFVDIKNSCRFVEVKLTCDDAGTITHSAATGDTLQAIFMAGFMVIGYTPNYVNTYLFGLLEPYGFCFYRVDREGPPKYELLHVDKEGNVKTLTMPLVQYYLGAPETPTGAYLRDDGTWTDPMIVQSSTEGSTKRFRLTVDDAGTISAVEVT